MNKLFLTIVIVLLSYWDAFSQATSLTIDCQTPGWLSSMINFEDQQTLKHLTVTGYLNGYDLQFIGNLNKNRSLKVVNLEDASLVQVSGEDDRYNRYYFRGGYFQKIVLPKSVKSIQPYYYSDPINGDSLIWTSPYVKEIDVECDLGKFMYTYIPDGVEKVGGMSDRPINTRITFPNSIDSVMGSSSTENLVIYSYIENPESVSAFFTTYTSTTGTQYWSSVNNSIFYIPKGTLDNYRISDFATKRRWVNGNNYGVNNGNIFIEFYDIDNTEVPSEMTLYKGESATLDVTISPDANLVSWIDYVSSNPVIASIDSEGTIVANDYGQAEVSATPHVFIEGLETKTGTCVVKVIAHVEGVEMQSALSLHIGEEKALNAMTIPLGVTDNIITYTCNDPSVATVSSTGVVYGKKRGSCVVTATSVDGGYEAECVVTVMQPVESLILAKNETTLNVGETEKLAAQIAPATADDKTITWSSSDEQVAKVDESGNVTAKKAGEASIMAVSNDNENAFDVCVVTVKQPVTGIQLNYSTYELNGIGSSFELKATVIPDDASNTDVVWSTSDESVCIVSHGLVVAVGTGVCVIIAKTEDGGFLATCTVTVKEATSISSNVQNENLSFKIYDSNGKRLSHLQQGFNLIVFEDGIVKKVVVK